jgi:hypothetical protein
VSRQRPGLPGILAGTAVLFVTGLCCLAPADPAAGAGGPLVRSPQFTRPLLPSGSVALGAVPSAQAVTFQLALQPSDPESITHLLGLLDDPSSPDYHHWLSKGQFVARFGPALSTITTAENWLRSQGITDLSYSGFDITATASAAQVTSALGTPLERYRIPGGRVGFAITEAPLVPQRLTPEISSFVGLDTTTGDQPQLAGGPPERAQPVDPSSPAQVPRGSGVAPGGDASPAADGLTPCTAAQNEANGGYDTLDSLGAAYGIGSLLADGQNGHGETIGVYELAAHSASDVATYATCFSLTNPVGTVLVDGGGAAGGEGTAEADLDIEQVSTQAPGASIVSYEGPNSATGAYDVWKTIVTEDTAQVVSSSWGECEPAAEADGTIGAYTTLFEQAAAQGQTVLVASGDSGSEGCLLSDGSTSEQVTYPASDPWVTAVGGTSDFGPGHEVAWNVCQSTETLSCAQSYGDVGAGGGGLSRYEPRPSFQPDILSWSIAQPCGTLCREVPDISANAGVGMVFYAGGAWALGEGTSFAAPFMAGLIADKNDGCTTSTGLFTPDLYALGEEDVYGSALTDITSGNTDLTGSNGGAYPANPGYDAATGWGSPDAAGLSCPEITSVNPTSALPGTTVAVSGLGLEKAAFSFNGFPGTVDSATATSAEVTLPSSPGTYTLGASSILGSGTQTSSVTVASPPPSPSPTSSGYDLVGADGGVFVFPQGQSGGFYGSLPGLGVSVHDIVGMVPTSSDQGYFLVGADGGVFSFGDAPYLGSLPGDQVSVDDIKAIVPTRDNGGYFLVGADGGVFSFGDAPYLGSLPGSGEHTTSVVGIAATPNDQGYWLITSSGAIYTFGNAGYYGEALNPPSPVTGIDATPDGAGYWAVTQDGSVYAFGDAGYDGSLPQSGVTPVKPVIGLVPTADEHGYWLIGSDGGIFAYGDAPFVGSLPELGINVSDIVGAVPTKVQ